MNGKYIFLASNLNCMITDSVEITVTRMSSAMLGAGPIVVVKNVPGGAAIAETSGPVTYTRDSKFTVTFKIVRDGKTYSDLPGFELTSVSMYGETPFALTPRRSAR